MDRLEELKVVELGKKIGYKKGFEDAKKQFERPHGEWVDGAQGYFCSECYYIDHEYFEHNFCPNCGADMREEGQRFADGFCEGLQSMKEGEEK